MQAYQTICICGGGSLGHTVAASISHKGYQVNLLTGHPSRWSHHIQITDCNNQIINGEISVISDNPKEVIPSSDIEMNKSYLIDGQLIGKDIKESGVLSNFQIHTITSLLSL